jgi:class 3 adenylate cyclase/TolB-like protein/Flp pilus assembly protein TadD
MPTTRTMTPPKIERRLAAIMVADVAGYSRLMGTDEVGTLSALKEHRRDRMDPTIARHNGRIFKATGDGLLVEFASVVDAVGCAVAIQRAMLAFNAGIHTDRQIDLRIGINVGDIIVDGDDIFGDGVNVAARLEALCEPGGVCISRSANEQVGNKLSLAFADLGPQTVKNIAQSVGVFGLAAKDIATLPDEALPAPEPPDARTPLAVERRGPTRTMIAGGVVLVTIMAVGGWWTLRDRTSPPVASAIAPSAPRPVAYSPQDRRQSVIVLPFENSSDDPTQDSLAVKMTRDMTNRIAQDRSKPIVPAQTASAYRGKSVDLHAIRQTHNVHFAVTGSVRRQNGRLMVSVNVYGTEDDRSVWSDQFNQEDREENYQAILHKIEGGFDQISADVEAAKAMREHPNALDKRDLMFASQVSSLSSVSKEHYRTKLSFVERALALDPDYVWALGTDARLLAHMVLSGISADPKADSARALTMIDRALQLRPDDWDTLKQKSRVLRAQGDLDGAAAVIRKLLEMNPQSAYRYFDLGIIRMIEGHPDEYLQNMLTARHLATIDDDRESIDLALALAFLANGRFDEAISQARLAGAEFSSNSRSGEVAKLAQIAADSLRGNSTDAKAQLQNFLSTPSTLTNLSMVKKQPSLAANANLLDGLRRAGMSEE